VSKNWANVALVGGVIAICDSADRHSDLIPVNGIGVFLLVVDSRLWWVACVGECALQEW